MPQMLSSRQRLTQRSQTRNDARFSTYSGAPSLQPSLAATVDTSPNRSSIQQHNSRYSEQTFLASPTIMEKNTGSIFGTTNSTATNNSLLSLLNTDPKIADLRSFANVLDRMNDERVDRQRFVMSSNKTEEVSKIALGAKVDRALSRRMVGQDAVFRTKKPLTEKRALAVEAN